MGAPEKALDEMAADEGNESPLKEGSDMEKETDRSEKSGRSSGENEIRPVKE